MEPRNYTLADLFEGNQVYIVPNYQRLYVWNQEDQWEPLWSDVLRIAQGLLDAAIYQDSETVDPDAVEPHFLGAVVLKSSGSTPDLSRRRRVIDGQQRLTTLQLLIAAAVRALADLGCDDSSYRLQELTVNSRRLGHMDIDSYKISHRRHKRGDSYERFPDVMEAALRDRPIVNIPGPMSRCYSFFHGNIRSWLSMHSSYANTAASALATTLIMKLQVVAIYLDLHEKEHIIFETLNARGEPLTEWDKIKNYLIYRADLEQGINQESFFEDYLDQFDTHWWRQRVGRGAQQRPRTDVFADYWLESRMMKPVAVRRVFREFQQHVDGEHNLEGMVQQLIRDAQYFKEFEIQADSIGSREALFHARRRAMSLGALWPLLLELNRMDADGRNRGHWLATLESYFVRRLITGRQARSYDQVALDLLKALLASEPIQGDVGEAIAEHLLTYSNAGKLWPTDEEVEKAVLHTALSWRAQRFVLVALERHLISKNWSANVELAANVQIEHIMPLSWTPENWPLSDASGSEDPEEYRRSVIYTLGNLTLLNGRLNSSISNAAWVIKRQGMQESDNLFLNSQLLRQSSGSWTERDIETRGRWMYDLIVDIWPRG